MDKRSGTLSADGTIDFGVMIDPILSVDGGTWGSGTLTVKFEGVAVDTGQTADFYKIYNSGGRPTKVTAVLSGSTSPSLTVNALHSDNRGRAVSS